MADTPLPNFHEQLEAIALKLCQETRRAGFSNNPLTVHTQAITEAITAIEAAVLELIGPDEDVEEARKEYGEMSRSFAIPNSRNQLRVQLREGLSQGGLEEPKEAQDV